RGARRPPVRRGRQILAELCELWGGGSAFHPDVCLTSFRLQNLAAHVLIAGRRVDRSRLIAPVIRRGPLFFAHGSS
ncbi:MAG: hypothetical protein M3O15_14185, partial [Acidobacteriota bacterium]|nr:hypothetical protein [Acidobacteriota bacterium]